MINGVIFDMDGTMFDTERMWATFWDPALKALGLPYKEGLAEAARGTAGETTRNVVRSFYGPDCDADGIVESLHRVADEVFLSAPVPKKPGLDALLAWLDEQRLPMAVASSSREAMIRNNLDQWGMTHYFKAIVSGQHVAHSKPDPEIFLLTAEKLGVEPAAAWCWKTATTASGPVPGAVLSPSWCPTSSPPTTRCGACTPCSAPRWTRCWRS